MTRLFAILIFLIWTATVMPAAVLTEIGGDLPLRLDARRSPYLVVSDLYVPAGRACSIDPGTVLMFRNFTGLKVQGTLLVNGTQDKEVVFTSEFDTAYNPGSTMRPNPFDWNGLYIDKDAFGSDLQFLRLVYSVYGIRSQTKFIRLYKTTLAYNGRGNCSVEGSDLQVGSEPFTYALSVTDARTAGIPIRILTDPQAPKRDAFRYGGLAVFVAGCAAGVWFTNEYAASLSHLKKLSSVSADNLIPHTDADWQRARSRRDANMTELIVGFLLGAIGGSGFSWSFTF